MRVLLLAVLINSAVAATGNDWPQWRGPDHDGISKEKGWTTDWPKEGPKKLWTAAVGTGFSSVAVAQGRLFTLGNKEQTDTVFCLEEAGGREIWKYSYPCALEPIYNEGGPGSTPTIDGAKVYTISKRGNLFCFDVANGKVLWQKNLLEELHVGKPRWGFAGSPLIQGNRLILNLGGAGTALDKAAGKVIWTSDTNAAGYATPVSYMMGDEPCVAIFSGKALVGVRQRDGHEMWRLPWLTHWDINIATPILTGNKLFISSFDRGCALLRLGGSTPTIVWSNKNLANHFNTCVLLNGFVYGIHGNTDQPERDFRCLDLATGEIKWKQDGLGLGSLIAADSKLIILSERGELVVAEASPAAFKPLARAQVLGGKCWTPPVLANGRVYCRNALGTLICLDLRAGGE